MGRPRAGLDEYLEWQDRFERFEKCEASLDEFCFHEGVSRSTYYRWQRQLRGGLPEGLKKEKADRERIESGQLAFVPITLKAAPVEVEYPNGTVLRLPATIGAAALAEILGTIGLQRPETRSATSPDAPTNHVR